MTEAMPFLQKYDITFLRPPTILRGLLAFQHQSDGRAATQSSRSVRRIRTVELPA